MKNRLLRISFPAIICCFFFLTTSPVAASEGPITEEIQQAIDDAKGEMRSAKAEAERLEREAAQRALDVINAVTQAQREAAEEAARLAREAADSAWEEARRLERRWKDLVEDQKRRLRELGEEAQERAEEFLDDAEDLARRARDAANIERLIESGGGIAKAVLASMAFRAMGFHSQANELDKMITVGMGFTGPPTPPAIAAATIESIEEVVELMETLRRRAQRARSNTTRQLVDINRRQTEQIGQFLESMSP